MHISQVNLTYNLPLQGQDAYIGTPPATDSEDTGGADEREHRRLWLWW